MNPANHQAENRAPATNAVVDVQELLKQMKEKNPQEVLGIGTKGGLVGAIVQATILTVILLALFTVGPYVWSKAVPPVAKVAPAKPTEKAAPTTQPAAPTTATAVATTPAAEKKDGPVSKDVLEKIAGTETKPANPKINPLDKTTDDLLKDLDKK